MCLEKSFQQIVKSIALVQFRWNTPYFAPRGHEKWHSSSLLSFPPLPPSNMRAVAKKVIMMQELFLFWEPLPSLLKTSQVQHLKPDSAKEAYFSSPQHSGWLLVSDLQHTCLYSPAQCLQLVQCCNLMISLCSKLSSAELLTVQSSSTFHLHTWLLLSKPNILHLSWLNCIQGYRTLTSLSHPSSTVTIRRSISQCYTKFI